MKSTRLRWAVIVVPALAITLFDYVRHALAPGVLHTWPGSLLFMALLVGGAVGLSNAVFQFFERRRRSLLGLAGDLAALGAVMVQDSVTQLGVLSAILERVLPALPVKAVAIYLLDQTGEALLRSAALGDGAVLASLPERIDARERGPAEALRSGAVQRLGDHLLPGDPSGRSRRAITLVPLRSRDTQLGLLVLAGGRWSALVDDLDLLMVLGSQIGVIVDNFRLFQETQQLLEQSRHLAVLEERDRLAREMHDSLAQVLSLVGIKARVIQELLNRREYARAAAEVADVAETADAAYADVREAILGLRESATQRGLVGSLRGYLQQLGRQSGLRTRLVIRPGAVTEFPPAAETQLVRVIQEALTNVRKHAQATTATVSFETDAPGWARIVVEDDGRGFDPASVAPDGLHGFGLQTMTERTVALGGQLEVESEVGRGTRVIVRLPLAPDEPLGGVREPAVALSGPA